MIITTGARVKIPPVNWTTLRLRIFDIVTYSLICPYTLLHIRKGVGLVLPALASLCLASCAEGVSPQARNIDIPPPAKAEGRQKALNERPDSVIYLPLGRDVLVPEAMGVDPLPRDMIGPFELRGETLGGALQLVLADIDIPIAFQTDQGLSKTVTVTNLKGPLSEVVNQLCSLSGLYCAYEHGSLVVKDKQTFTVTIPPMGAVDDRTAIITNIGNAIKAVTGNEPVVDASNRTIVYEATSQTASEVSQYLQRLRASTSMIVYETYIWEVSLRGGNSTGINWDLINTADRYHMGISMAGSVSADVGTPISIGLPTEGDVNFTTGDVLKFISSYGAVKTISQPQLTVLSGSSAKMRVADKQNYVSKITRTVTGDQVTVATETDSVESGFTLEIGSSWDNGTVYGDMSILLQEVRQIQTFDDNPEAIVQLPQTTEREVTTQVRVRPGDSLLIGGLVREIDNLSKEGLGLEQPIIPNSRTAQTSNVELVFLLKPRVIVFTDSSDRFERRPIERDAPAKPVELRMGDEQSHTPTSGEQDALGEQNAPMAVFVPPPPPLEKTSDLEKAQKPEAVKPVVPARPRPSEKKEMNRTSRDLAPVLQKEDKKKTAPLPLPDKKEPALSKTEPIDAPVMSEALAPRPDVVQNLFSNGAVVKSKEGEAPQSLLPTKNQGSSDASLAIPSLFSMPPASVLPTDIKPEDKK